MQPETIIKALNIRYTELKFTIEFAEDSVLPLHKASALRGGMGQRLLEQCCVRDRRCDGCDFENDCLVRRIMYARYDIEPPFAGKGDSNGYCLDCEDKRTSVRCGDRMYFTLVLFGKVIPYFSQLLQAFYQLGQMGIGRERARYVILRVDNEDGQPIVKGTQVYMRRLKISLTADYARRRVMDIARDESFGNTLVFHSPATIKYNGNLIESFSPEPVVRSVMRRIYSLDCFEGIDVPRMICEDMPGLLSQKAHPVHVPRYSSSQDTRMTLHGITGSMVFENIPVNLLMCLAAGEKLHIGKNTSFGFGKYKLV